MAINLETCQVQERVGKLKNQDLDLRPTSFRGAIFFQPNCFLDLDMIQPWFYVTGVWQKASSIGVHKIELTWVLNQTPLIPPNYQSGFGSHINPS